MACNKFYISFACVGDAALMLDRIFFGTVQNSIKLLKQLDFWQICVRLNIFFD